MKTYEKIHKIASSRLIYYPSNEIYGNIAGFYDFGPIGHRIKQRLIAYWRKFFVKANDFFEIESSIVTPEIVLKASGHVDNFTDFAMRCNKCGFIARADKFLEQYGFIYEKNKVKDFVYSKKIRCPSCNALDWSFEDINLMFSTQIGYNKAKAYLRPETAQGIFTSFSRVFKNVGKLPIAISQVGKSFRNEISPRKGLVRLREFTQMEIEYFFNPKKQENNALYKQVKGKTFRVKFGKPENKGIKEMSVEEFKDVINNDALIFFLAKEWEFYKHLGIDENRMWFRVLPKDETPHYSKINVDLEIETSYGDIEVVSNAYRQAYDLSNHAKFSGKAMEVVEEGERFVPHVVEASIGVERSIFCILEHSFIPKGEKAWDWFAFSPIIAPYDVAVFPLVKKDGLPEIALNIRNKLMQEGLEVIYKENNNIGKRYARADEIGIPYAITIDYQTKEDNTVTIRYRDNTKQERVAIDKLYSKIKNNIKNRKTAL